MKNNVFILSFLLTTILMAACGGADSRIGETQTSEANAEKISGVWASGQFKGPSFDELFPDGQYYDEQFTVIKPTGIIVNYDYTGDSYNRGKNCYKKKEGTIKALGNNEFEITYEGEDAFIRRITVERSVVQNIVLVSRDLSSDEFTTFLISALFESYFAPLCDLDQET